MLVVILQTGVEMVTACVANNAETFALSAVGLHAHVTFQSLGPMLTI